MRCPVILIVLASACGRIAFDSDPGESSPVDAAVAPDAGGPVPVHVYRLDGTLDDDRGGAPLASNGGELVPGGGYRFAANQGLTTSSTMPSRVYTVEIRFSFDEVASWRKVIDVNSLVAEPGLYVWDSTLTYVVVPSVDHVVSQPRLVAGQLATVVLTRDAAGTVVGYVAGQRAITFVDSLGVAALNAGSPTFRFFMDDAVNGGNEASPGLVQLVRIYDVALSATEVASL